MQFIILFDLSSKSHIRLDALKQKLGALITNDDSGWLKEKMQNLTLTLKQLMPLSMEAKELGECMGSFHIRKTV
jgi:hypothetical protein